MATAIAFPPSMEPQRSLSTGGDWVKVELEHAHGDDGLPLDGTEVWVANPRARLPVALLRPTNLHVPAILHTHLALLFTLLYTYATRILTARLPSIGSPSPSPSASSSQDPSPTGSKYPSTTPSHSSSKQYESTSGSGSSSSSPTYPTQATFSLSLPASASPFPSPSSSFLPPPVPGVHEFAMKPPPAVLNGGSSNGSNGVGLGINGGGLSVNGGGAGTRSRSSSTRATQNGATANGASDSTLVQGTATSASVNGTITGTSASAGSGDISQLASSDVSGSSTSREGLLSSSLAPTPHTASPSISASTATEAELSSGHSNTEGETKTKTKGEAGAVEGGSTTTTYERARVATSAELGGHEAKREGACGGGENNKGVRGFGASRGEGGDKTEAVKADPEPFKAVPGTEAKISGGKEIGKEVNGKGMDTDIGGMGSKMSKVSKASGQKDVDAAPMGSIPPAAASTAPALPAPTVSTPAPTASNASSTTTTSPPPPVFSSHQPQAPLSPTSPVPTSPTTSSSSSSTTQTSAQLKKHQHRVSLPPPSSFPVALGLSTSSSSSSGSGGAVHRQTSSVSSTTSTGSAGAVSPSVSSSTPIPVASFITSSIPTSIATIATAPMSIATTPSGTIPRTPGPRSRPPSSYFDPTLSPLLASSRPAPPSPALSATSKGGRGSRPVSGVFSLDGFNSGMSGIGMSGIGSGGMSRQNSMKKAKRVSSGLGMSVNLGSPTSARFAPASWLSQSQGQSPLVFGAKADDREPDDSEREPPPDSAASIESLESNASTVVPDGPGTPGTPGVVFAGFQRERLGQSGGSAAAAVGREGQHEEEEGGWERAKEKKEGKKRTFYIKIKDFGFEPQDPKFCGMGENVPKENRVGRLNRVLRGAGMGYDPYAKPPLPPLTTDSTNPEAGAATPTAEEQKRWSQGSWASCSSFPHSPVTPTASSLYGDGYDDEEEEDDDDYGYGWGGGGGGWFRKGLGKLNWAGVGSSASDGQNDDEEEGEGYPSAGDLARNFDQDGEDLSGGSGVGGVYDEPDSFDSFADDLDDADDPLYPGIYRALFAFEPEGTAEVRLREDQLVRVVKRGGGVGWAVVEVGWKAGKDLVKELRESGELDDVDVVDGEDGEGDDSEEQEKGAGCTEGGGVEVVMGDGKKLRQGLVPESYLAPVRLDGWVDCS